MSRRHLRLSRLACTLTGGKKKACGGSRHFSRQLSGKRHVAALVGAPSAGPATAPQRQRLWITRSAPTQGEGGSRGSEPPASVGRWVSAPACDTDKSRRHSHSPACCQPPPPRPSYLEVTWSMISEGCLPSCTQHSLTHRPLMLSSECQCDFIPEGGEGGWGGVGVVVV